MPNPLTILIGRAVQMAAGLRGGGSALPGLVVEKLEPHFAVDVLARLPLGVVLVSGTNGKTTTVKAVTELLATSGLRVFTNNTGSNFMRGVISSLLRRVSLTGRLDADIAVLELDEAHAVAFAQAVRPRYTLLLNVMRDQLDRFGEIDYTARLLSAVAQATTEVVVLNREDSRLAALPAAAKLTAEVRWFGLAPQLRCEFPEDDALYEADAVEQVEPGQAPDKTGAGTYLLSEVANELPVEPKFAATSDKSPVPACPELAPVAPASAPSTVLTRFSSTCATIEVDGTPYEAKLALRGIYNVFNATAALALVHAVLPQEPVEALTKALAQVQPAFGRGEVLVVDGSVVELVLVKNPGGFRLALRGHGGSHPQLPATMIVINDDYADGRDMSWLFDVGFEALRAGGVTMLSGVRAYDMALRLEYDEVSCVAVEPDISKALDAFLANPAEGVETHTSRRIYCTYTAMLALRRLLATKTEVERIQ